MLLLLPCDPLDPRRPDEHFAAEGAAARSAGIPVALVDHDALVAARPDERIRPARLAGADPGDRGDAGVLPRGPGGCTAQDRQRTGRAA